jgi:hypothetical protein
MNHIQKQPYGRVGEYVVAERGVARCNHDVRKRNGADRQDLAGEMLAGLHVMALSEISYGMLYLRNFHRYCSDSQGVGLAEARM